jgi:uncharacterized protein involved in exopolysaccharide biosynthesis
VKRFEYGIGSRFSQNLAPDFASDEMDLRELWMAIWQCGRIILVITVVFTIGSVFYALSVHCASA